MKRVQQFSLVLLALFFSQTIFATEKYFLITHGSADFYWQALFNGAKEAARQWKVKLQIIAPLGANNTQAQVANLQNALATHPAGIATSLPSNSAFSRLLQKAQHQHTPIIAVDAKPSSQKGNPYLAFIGSDNLSLGEFQAHYVLKHYQLGEHVVIANPQPGQMGLEQRAAGLKKALEQANIKVTKMNVGAEPAKVEQIMRSYLIRHRNISAIFSLTSQALIPIAGIFHHQKSKTHPLLFSFDNTPKTAELIAEKEVSLTTNQQPFLMGYYALSQLVLFHRYGIQPVDINTGAGIVDIKNVNKVALLIKEGIV